jgi:hypothetical protein
MLGVVADSLTGVGELHLGLVYDVVLSEPLLFVGSERDKAEFVYANKNSIHELGGWPEIAKIAGALDPWSKLLLESSVGQQLLESPGPHPQQPLPLAVDRPKGDPLNAVTPVITPDRDR